MLSVTIYARIKKLMLGLKSLQENWFHSINLYIKHNLKICALKLNLALETNVRKLSYKVRQSGEVHSVHSERLWECDHRFVHTENSTRSWVQLCSHSRQPAVWAQHGFDHFSVLEKLMCVLQACVNNAVRLTHNQVS